MSFKIVNGEVRITKSQQAEAIKWIKKKIEDAGLKTKNNRPAKPKDLPKFFIDGERQIIKNRAPANDLSLDGFGFQSVKSKTAQMARRGARLSMANLDPLNAANYGKWNKLVKGLLDDVAHHSGPASVTGELVKKIEQLADPNWKPDIGITSAGKNFLRNLHKRLDVHGGNSLLNFDWYPNETIHQQAHRILVREGIDVPNPANITAKFTSPNDVYKWVKESYKPAIDKVTEELGDFSLRSSGLKPGTASFFQRSPHLFRDYLLEHKGKITKASMLKLLTSAPKTFAAQYSDLFIPDKEVADKLKKENKVEGLKMYGKQIFRDVTTTGLFSGITKLALSKGGAGAAIAGAPAAVPLAVASGVYAVKRLDDNVFDGAIQKGLESTKHSYLNPLLGEEAVKEGTRQYEKNAKEYADKGGWDVSGYSF